MESFKKKKKKGDTSKIWCMAPCQRILDSTTAHCNTNDCLIVSHMLQRRAMKEWLYTALNRRILVGIFLFSVSDSEYADVYIILL